MTSQSNRMPMVFAGHGSPMNAILDNVYSRGFAQLGRSLPRPRAIVAISAHWWADGTRVTGQAQPPTLHDFSGFPEALHAFHYPASGQVELASRVCDVLKNCEATLDTSWGLDHGTWSVLCHMYPKADLPVIQVSLDARAPPSRHWELGTQLAALREEGVLLLGSGNVTHNLRDAFTRMQRQDRETPDWAWEFDAEVTRALTQKEASKWVSLWPNSKFGRLAHPTPEHFLPLLYIAGAATKDDRVSFVNEGFDFGSLSMRSVVFE